jgi:aspartate aminotransferase
MSRIPLAPSLANVQASRIREIADVAFGMEDVLRLHFGESNLPTPQYIKDAAARAMSEGYTYYTENAGLPSLREALARKYADLHRVELNPESEILITASGVQALNVAIRCTVDPGDEALILTPNWPNASAIVSMFGAIPREIPLLPVDDGFAIDFDALTAALSPRTRLLVYASPSNPLGWVASQEDQRQLLAFCRARGLWLLADEVYERLYFDGPVAPSILRTCSRDDAAIVVQSFSKTYCMTGWRLGWVVSRPDLVRQAAQLNEFIVSHAPSMVQRAGETALRDGEPEVARMLEALTDQVTYCYDALSAVPGLSVPRPRGAFYLFPRVDRLTDSFALALALLNEERVSVAPGVAFGNGGEGAFRICAAADRSILEPAMERIIRFLASCDPSKLARAPE